jgi:hypothetical protein
VVVASPVDQQLDLEPVRSSVRRRLRWLGVGIGVRPTRYHLQVCGFAWRHWTIATLTRQKVDAFTRFVIGMPET